MTELVESIADAFDALIATTKSTPSILNSRGRYELAQAALSAIEAAGSTVLDRQTLQWWRELVDLNPQDLAPRMDARLRALAASPMTAAKGEA